MDAAVAGMRSGRSPNVSSITRPSSEAAHLRERRWQTDPRSRVADLTYAGKDDRWHHAGPQCQGRNRLSQNGEPSWQPSLRPKFGLLAGLKTVVAAIRETPLLTVRPIRRTSRGARYTVQMAVLLASPDPTPVEPPHVYFDDNFRNRLIARVTDPIVARFWRKEFGVTKGSKRQFEFELDLPPGSNSEDGTISETSIRLVRMRTG